ncbi:MAG TPA: PDZ domain-containing protein, partial [Thermoanaerobaculia bacterium]|nr:PDZ domain-containing protein [Thermoanaerobaculia bacterium]
VNTLKEILPQLRDKGKVSRGYLGISIRNLDYNQAQAFGLSNTDGALVQSIEPDTPAADAGVQHGDIIVAVDGHKIKSTRDLISYVSAKGPNASVNLDLLRDGKSVTKTVKLRERPLTGQPEEETNNRKPQGKSGVEWLGIQYQDLSGSLRQGHAIPDDVQGIVVTSVSPTSPLYEQLVRPGMVISEVNGRPIKGVADFESAIKSAKKGSYLRLYTQQLAQGGGRPTPFFAVVQVP